MGIRLLFLVSLIALLTTPGLADTRKSCSSGESISYVENEKILEGGDCTSGNVETLKSHVSDGELEVSITDEDRVLDYGERTKVNVDIWHDDPNVNYDCQIRVDGGEWTDFEEIVRSDTSSGPQSVSKPIRAPNSEVQSQQEVNLEVNVYCYGPADEEPYGWLGNWVAQGYWTLDTSYRYPAVDTIRDQEVQSEINSAESVKNRAEGKKSKAEEKVDKAESMDLEVEQAERSYEEGQSEFNQGESALNSAKSFLDSEKFSRAENKASRGENMFEDSITSFEQVVKTVEEVIDRRKVTAKNKIDEAESSISDASSSIEDAESKIDEASDAGAIVTAAQNSLETAKSDVSGADDYLSQAKNSFDLGNYQEASSKAKEAQSAAQSSKTSANNAKSAAKDAIQQRRSNAEGKINSAATKIENLRSAIGKLEDKIKKAKSNGLSVDDERQRLKNSRDSLGRSETLLSDARTSFDNGNYGEALNTAQSALNKASSARDNVKSALNSLGASIPDPGSSSVSPGIQRTVEDLLSADQEISQEQAELKANNFEKKDIAVTPSAGPSYSVETIYTHPSGDTITLSSTVNTAEDIVSDVSLSGDPSQVNQKWKKTQSTQQTRNSILMFAGAAILLIIAGAFAYYFVNPVNKTVNNFVGGDDADGSGSGSKFDCPSCGAPVTPDDLEEGECPYCGSTVSP